MNLESLYWLLAPMILSTMWSLFTFTKSMVVSLVTLMFASLALPLLFMENYKLFWPCGLLLILMSTGLIVIFAYIVSLHSKEWKASSGAWLLTFTFSLILLSMSLITPPVYKMCHPHIGILVDLQLSFILIALLLFLVVSFIRNVYSKGGGFRKKF